MKNVLKGLISLMAVLVFAIGVVYLFPQVIINEFALSHLVNFAKRFDQDISWQKLSASAHSRRIVNKQIRLELSGLCLRTSVLDGCFEKFIFDMEIRIPGFSLALNRLGPVDILSTQPLVFKGSKEKSEDDEDSSVLEILRRARFKDININLAELRIPGDVFSLENSLILHTTTDQIDVKLDMLVRGDSSLKYLKLAAVIKQDSEGLDLQGAFKLNVNANVALANGMTMVTQADLNQDSPSRHDLNANVQIVDGGVKSKVKVRGGHRSSLVTLDLDGRVTIPRYLDAIDFNQCNFKFNVSEDFNKQIPYTTNCHLALTRAAVLKKSIANLPIPKHGYLAVQSHGRLPPINHLSGALETSTKFNLTPITARSYTVDGGLDANVNGDLGDFPKNLKLSFNLYTRLLFPQFEVLVKDLHSTAWSVPAPFDELRGPLECSLEGESTPSGEAIHVPLKCKSDLNRKPQAFVVDVGGSLVVPLKDQVRPMLDLDILVKNLRVQLPNISLTQKPTTLLPDKRLVKTDHPPPKTGPSLDYKVRIRTEKENSLLIYSNLSPKGIPISLDVTASTANLGGHIRVNQFPVEIIRRDIMVKYLTMTLNNELEQSAMQGELKIDQTTHLIYVRVSGTIKRPVINLESEPALSEREILAYLLFGREPTELDSDNMRSVEETRAAMADGAIGLISMYYLASTPIESVGYNPHTGLYSARFRLGETVSLTLGSDWDSYKRAGIQKRLGRNWSFTTSISSDEQTQKQSSTAMLEWSNRY